jgi:hypothetical protein
MVTQAPAVAKPRSRTRLAGQIGVSLVLVYRALTWGLQIPVGVVCYLWWRRSQLWTNPITAGNRHLTICQAGGDGDHAPSGHAGKRHQAPAPSLCSPSR